MYRRKSATAERSYWFCCRKKCSAKGILRPDGKFQFRKSEHNHEPEFESIRKKEKLIELKKLALELNISGQDILETLNIKEDVKKHLSFIRTCRRRAKRRSPPETPVKVGLDYIRLPSRVNSKEMILHSGYIFRQDSKNPLRDEYRYWKCRLKSCKARAKTDELGNLTILKVRHCHPPEETDMSKLLRKTTSVLDKYESRRIEKGESLAKLIQRVRHNDAEEKLKPLIIGSTDLRFSPSVPDSETFNLDKLMAETLADCDTSDFTDALLKS